MADKLDVVSIGPAAGITGNVRTKYKDMGDGTHALVVATVDGDGGGGDASIDRELVVTTYVVKTAFTGASVGDTITSVQVIDVTDTPTTVGVVWRNQSTGLDLAAAPSAADLNVAGQPGLTDAQLRAAALSVTGPLTNAQLTAVTGSPTTGAWDGVVTSATATIIGVLKAIWSAIRSLAPASAAAVVTPSDSTNLVTPSRAIWVGTGGDISIQMGGAAVIHKNVPSGSRLDVVATRVNVTGTTAADIVSWS